MVETEEGKSNQIQNEEEMVKEENEKENTLNFGRESSDSLEDCPKEVWQTDGRPNPFSVTGSELQIKEDTRAVILIPPEDNRVDEGENDFYGVAYKHKLTSSCSSFISRSLLFFVTFSHLYVPFFAAPANVCSALFSSCEPTVTWEDYEQGDCSLFVCFSPFSGCLRK